MTPDSGGRHTAPVLRDTFIVPIPSEPIVGAPFKTQKIHQRRAPRAGLEPDAACVPPHPPAHVTYTILDRYSHLASLSREAAVQRGVKDFREDAVMIGRPKDRAINQTTRSVQY